MQVLTCHSYQSVSGRNVRIDYPPQTAGIILNLLNVYYLMTDHPSIELMGLWCLCIIYTM